MFVYLENTCLHLSHREHYYEGKHRKKTDIKQQIIKREK